MKKRIIQSFWTAPMRTTRMQDNVRMATLSLEYAHSCGYEVGMYTDSDGAELLSDLPYDTFSTSLDDMPPVRHPGSMFAAGKYFALRQEPTGVVHTDFDVFLRKPCLDSFFAGEGDAVCQCREYIWREKVYRDCADLLREEFCPKAINPVRPHYSYNVGVIGFNSPRLKDLFVSTYMEAFDYYKDRNPQTLLDFFLEQAFLYQLRNKYDIRPLIKGTCFENDWSMMKEEANEIGYCHLQSSYKYLPSIQNRIQELLEVSFGY